jgi:beta-alanine--pyruvate transaminase
MVADLRGYGLMAAVDLPSDGVPGRRGHALQKKLFDSGLHLKATGDCVIIAPPLVAERKHVDVIVDVLRKTLPTL